MIKANELRIGNYFWEDYGGYKIVTEIRKKIVCGRGLNFDISGGFSFDGISPIPLTPEILIQCGLEEANFRNQWRFAGQFLEQFEDHFELIVGDNEIYIAEVKYLHQLQNLYFSLTGTELEINLTALKS